MTLCLYVNAELFKCFFPWIFLDRVVNFHFRKHDYTLLHCVEKLSAEGITKWDWRRDEVGNLIVSVYQKPCVCTADQELFSGMYIDFMGTDAAIFRSLTQRNAVRSDQHNSKWLSGEKAQHNGTTQQMFFKKKEIIRTPLCISQSRYSSTLTWSRMARTRTMPSFTFSFARGWWTTAGIQRTSTPWWPGCVR